MSQALRNIQRVERTGETNGALVLDFPAVLERNHDAIAKALPKHLDPDRMCRIALTAFRKSPALGRCDPMSVLAAVVTASQLGLEIMQNGESFLVPFKTECQLIPGYKGLMKLARNSGMVRDIYAHEVRLSDEFDYELGLQRRLLHKPLRGRGNFPASEAERGEVVGYYAVALLRDETSTFVMMSNEDVLRVRDASRGYQAAKRDQKSHPWDTHPVPMGKKTVIRALCNSSLPLSAELRLAIALDSAAELGVSQKINLRQAADGTYEPPSYDEMEKEATGAGASQVQHPTAPARGLERPVYQRPMGTASGYRSAPSNPVPREQVAAEQYRPHSRAPASQPPAQREAVQTRPSQPPVQRTPPVQTARAPAPHAPVPPRESVKPQKPQFSDEVMAAVAKLEACTSMFDLEEVAIRAESTFTGADLVKISQVYAEKRGKLENQQGGLFRGD